MIETILMKRGAPPPDFAVITGSYKSLAAAAIARDSHCTVAINNKLYTFGGSYGGLNTVMEVYDIASNTWSTISPPSKPSARHGMACCVLDGKFYMFGGSLGGAWTPMTNEAYAFDPATEVWTKLANVPKAVGLHSAAALNGKIYLFNGFDGSGSVADFYEYDPAANTYRSIAHAQGNTHGHRAAVIGNRMFILGGVAGAGASNRVISYEPVSNTWQAHNGSPISHSYAYCAVIGDNIYLFGGSLNTNTTTNNRLFKYNFGTGLWTELISGGTASYLGWMAATDKALYLHGGIINNTTPLNMLWEIT